MDNAMKSSSQGDGAKKSPLESLTKDELIKKCKGLLQLAQKAKASKDEFSNENRELKEKLDEYLLQREADKSSILTMKELVDSLTENKLNLTNQISSQNTIIKNLEESLSKIKQENNNLSIENESISRQVKRLTDENEELLSTLDKMESSDTNVIKELQEKCDKYKVENTAQTEKIGRIKNRLLEVSRKLTKLKESKVMLLETQNEYASSVTKWQDDIFKASKILHKHIDKIEEDKKVLESKLTLTSSSLSMVSEYLPVLVSLCNKSMEENNLSNKDNLETYSEAKILELECTNKQLSIELDNLKQILKNLENKNHFENNSGHKIFELESCNEQLSLELENLKANLKDFENDSKRKILELESSNEKLSLELTELKDFQNQNKFENGTENNMLELKSCNQKLSVELTELKQKLKDLQNVSSIEELPIKREYLSSIEFKLEEMQKCLNLAIEEKENVLEKCRFLEKSNSDLEDAKKSQQMEITSLKENIDSLRENVDLVDTLKEKMIYMENDLQTSKDAKKDNEELIKKSQILEKENIELKNEIENLNLLKTELHERETRISELLSEMRELNEALKGRGDLISRQQEKIVDLEKSISNLEKERDDLKKMDERTDELSTSTISRAEELSQMREVDDSLLEKYNKLRTLAAKLKKKCQDCQKEMTLQAKNLQALQKENDKLQDEIESQKQKVKTTESIDIVKEKESFNLIKCEIEKEKNTLKNELQVKLKELESQKLEIQKLQAAKKQSNVLGLEVEAYEKSLNNISQKLQEKNEFVKDLESKIESNESKISSLQQEINLLEENLNGEKKNSMELKQKLDSQYQSIKIQEHEKGDLVKKNSELQLECESLKAEKEELKFSISETSNKSEQICSTLRKDKELLAEKVLILEEQVEYLEKKVQTTQRDFENINDEFTSYKVKAQSVLRQNCRQDSSKERELEYELEEIKQEKESLNKNLQLLVEQNKLSDNKISELKMDNERLQKRCKELMELIEESREQNDLLLKDNKKQNESYQESLKSHRIQIDTMNQYYKEQLDELVSKHKLEIEKMSASKRLSPFGANSQTNSKSADELKIDLLLMEREDAEGSEFNMPPNSQKRKNSQIQTRSKHNAIPLDELLNSSVELDDEIYNQGDDDQDEMSLRGKLSAQTNQVKHLTSLLAEIEQDLAKLTQQNSLLKEEIRRNERAEEREKHMHNSEYLKNVFLKFITLSNCDERLRLVPVLNTILKLSREENQALENVVKGKGSDSGNRGWGLLWSKN